jgi:HlyD family secretion protein
VIFLAMKQNVFLSLGLCVSMSLLSVTGCKKTEETPSAEVNVQAEKPEIGPISEYILADATLSPLAQAAISPKITAPVRAFYVQRGSHVKAGQLLAQLEDQDLTATALDNKGQFQAAEAVYETQTKAQVQEDYRKAELDLAQAKSQVDLNASIVAARKKLFSEGAIPGRDLDTATAALVQAQATYDLALNHLRAMQNVSRAAALKQAQGQLTSAEGKYRNAEAQVSYSQIRSPIDGVVTDRPLFPGETAASGTTVITIMDTSSLLAKVHLAQTSAQRLKIGDDATIQIPGVTDPAPAKISLISPALDPGSTTVEVWLRVDNRNATYKAGTPVRASITGRTVASAMKVPLAAILTAQDGSKSVMVIGSDGAAHRKTVTLGINNGEDVEVKEGLTKEDMVITTGAYALDEGTKVKIGSESDKDKAGDEK